MTFFIHSPCFSCFSLSTCCAPFKWAGRLVKVALVSPFSALARLYFACVSLINQVGSFLAKKSRSLKEWCFSKKAPTSISKRNKKTSNKLSKATAIKKARTPKTNSAPTLPTKLPLPQPPQSTQIAKLVVPNEVSNQSSFSNPIKEPIEEIAELPKPVLIASPQPKKLSKQSAISSNCQKEEEEEEDYLQSSIKQRRPAFGDSPAFAIPLLLDQAKSPSPESSSPNQKREIPKPPTPVRRFMRTLKRNLNKFNKLQPTPKKLPRELSGSITQKVFTLTKKISIKEKDRSSPSSWTPSPK